MAKTPLEGVTFPNFDNIRDGARSVTHTLTNADFTELRRLTIAAKDSAYCTHPPLHTKPF